MLSINLFLMLPLHLTAFTTAGPLPDNKDCTTTVTKTKTKTSKDATSVVFTTITDLFIQTTTTGSGTNGLSCPSSMTGLMPRGVLTTSSSVITTVTDLSIQLATPIPLKHCKFTKTVHKTITIGSNATKSATRTTSMTSTHTSHATSTATLFYLQSSIDGSFAEHSTNGTANDGSSYLTFEYLNHCTSSSALFSLDTTTQQLTDHATGYIASNAAAPGATGEIVGFASPASIASGNVQPLKCALSGGVLSCGLFSSNSIFESCDGIWCWGAQSHLCQALTVTAVAPALASS